MNDNVNCDLDWKILTLNRKRRQFMDERLATYQLSGPLYSFLICIEKNPGNNQDFLANFFCIDKGAVAHLAKRLEKLEYIGRQTSSNDRRAYQLTLTEKGREILPIIFEHLNEWNRVLLKGFSADDHQTALDLLQRMAENTR